MSKDKVTLKVGGQLMQLVLHSGGVKSFIYLDAVIGVVCLLFSFVTQSLVPFGFYAILTIGIFCLLTKLALSPDGWAFFLESNFLFQVIKMQMKLIGDKQIGKVRMRDTKLVQPVLEPPRDILTEAKLDHKKALVERRVK